MNVLKLPIVLGITLAIYFSVFKIVNSFSQIIQVDVGISICGNNVIEGGEDCEGLDLNNKTCQSLGYASGDLSCDSACTFDTYLCIPATPSPTPTATNTPLEPLNTPTIQPITNELPTTISFLPTPEPTPLLPAPLRLFDINGIDRILSTTLKEVVRIWLTEKEKTLESPVADNSLLSCDLNYDGVCDLIDFSILLYYVDRYEDNS